MKIVLDFELKPSTSHIPPLEVEIFLELQRDYSKLYRHFQDQKQITNYVFRDRLVHKHI